MLADGQSAMKRPRTGTTHEPWSEPFSGGSLPVPQAMTRGRSPFGSPSRGRSRSPSPSPVPSPPRRRRKENLSEYWEYNPEEALEFGASERATYDRNNPGQAREALKWKKSIKDYCEPEPRRD
jgi:hypothetical protein